jgi:hypothetical protein
LDLKYGFSSKLSRFTYTELPNFKFEFNFESEIRIASLSCTCCFILFRKTLFRSAPAPLISFQNIFRSAPAPLIFSQKIFRSAPAPLISPPKIFRSAPAPAPARFRGPPLRSAPALFRSKSLIYAQKLSGSGEVTSLISTFQPNLLFYFSILLILFVCLFLVGFQRDTILNSQHNLT